MPMRKEESGLPRLSTRRLLPENFRLPLYWAETTTTCLVGGDSIHDAGIMPDIVVERTEEDYKNEIDAQYNKAVELLRQGVKPEDLEPIPAPAGGETDGLPDEGSEL